MVYKIVEIVKLVKTAFNWIIDHGFYSLVENHQMVYNMVYRGKAFNYQIIWHVILFSCSEGLDILLGWSYRLTLIRF